jgi:hypothetical protein
MVFGLLETHRRHNLKSLLYEFFGEQDLPFVLDSGAQLISDFADWYREHGKLLPEPARRPFLVGLEHEKMRARPAAWFSWLFHTREARVGLSPAEQKIACRALAGETDAQLTLNPAISKNTVRRHWGPFTKSLRRPELS